MIDCYRELHFLSEDRTRTERGRRPACCWHETSKPPPSIGVARSLGRGRPARSLRSRSDASTMHSRGCGNRTSARNQPVRLGLSDRPGRSPELGKCSQYLQLGVRGRRRCAHRSQLLFLSVTKCRQSDPGIAARSSLHNSDRARSDRQLHNDLECELHSIFGADQRLSCSPVREVGERPVLSHAYSSTSFDHRWCETENG